MTIGRLLIAAALITGAAGAAQAQSTYLDATAGTATLSMGWTPDPYAVQLSNNPTILLEPQGLAPGCYGYVTDAPDYKLYYSGGGTLYLSADSVRQSILLVNDGAGNWHCGDGSLGNRIPAMSLQNAPSGRYDIWVGAVFEGSPGAATLYISNRGGGPNPTGSSPGGSSGGLGLPPAPSTTGSQPDPSLQPSFGEVTLVSPTNPDPFSTDLLAGGWNPASSVQSGCAGFVATAPDFDLYYTPGNYPLIISAASGTDTTLLINDPDGNWYCDDDGGDGPGNPSIRFDRPLAGLYDIWVGTYRDEDGTPSATLWISEVYTQ